MSTGPRTELRDRVLAEAARVPSRTRADERRRIVILTAAAAAATAVLFFVTGGFFWGARPNVLIALTAGLGFFGALLLSRLSGLLGTRTMLGRSGPVLVGGSLAVVLVLSLVALGAAALWPEQTTELIELKSHVGCAVLTLVQAAIPLLVFVFPRRGSDPVHPATTGAAFGVTAGAWAAAMAYLRCPHVAAAHCVLAHIVPALVLGAIGALIGRAVLKVR
jgi:hypothetical protein